jgi:hypothetical protein
LNWVAQDEKQKAKSNIEYFILTIEFYQKPREKIKTYFMEIPTKTFWRAKVPEEIGG